MELALTAAARWAGLVPRPVSRPHERDPLGGALLVLITAGLVGVLGIGVAVLIMGVIVAALVTATVALADRRDVAPAVAATDAPVDPS